MAAGSARAVPGEQRVFSLILALVAAPQGATKRTLLSSVYGYAERFASGGDPASLERQFERDKDTLRELGVPLEVIDSPEEPGNNQLARYRIAKERLQHPEAMRYSPEELSVLRLAALSWREGSLSAEAQRATMKLAAHGAAVDVRHLGVAPRIGSPDPAAQQLHAAIAAGRPVRFLYRMPGREAALSRFVAPLALHRADGRWHLIAWDLDRSGERVFLLARIEGPVAAQRGSIDPGLRELLPAAIARLESLAERQRALVRVAPGSEAEARLRPRSAPAAGAESRAEGGDLLSVGYLDEALLAEELAGYGADAQVYEPAALRAGTIAALRRIRDAHAAPTGEDSP